LYQARDESTVHLIAKCSYGEEVIPQTDVHQIKEWWAGMNAAIRKQPAITLASHHIHNVKSMEGALLAGVRKQDTETLSIHNFS
jgi:hypothetical protein